MDIMNWRKSSYSGGNGAECLLAGNTSRHVVVKDSKDPESPVLAFTPEGWRTFVAQLKNK